MANRYADRPYAVGKGKPPVSTRYQPGHKPSKRSGRPKGSKGKSLLRKFLDEPVDMPGKGGTTVKVPLEHALDRRLIQLAIQDGDLRAIALIKKLIALDRAEEGVVIDKKEEAERKRLSAKLVEILELAGRLKLLGLVETIDGRLAVSRWAVKMATARQRQDSSPLDENVGENGNP